MNPQQPSQRRRTAQAWVHRWAFSYLVFLLFLPLAHLIAAESVPQPGPENGGLRLRLQVLPIANASNETYAVRADLINATTNPLTVSALWGFDKDQGDFKDYFESALSIETEPKIVFWGLQVMADHRTTPQPVVVIPPNGSVSVEWKSSGRRLKNKLTHPLEVMNPYFPTDGLFGVHAELKVEVSGKQILMRSNEQLVPIGGSFQMPKASSAEVAPTSPEKNDAVLYRGALHGVAVGDEFLVRTGMSDFWLLKITHVQDRWSTASMTVSDKPFAGRTNASVVKPGMRAGLIPLNARGTEWMW